jgi:hypothetical protein
MHNDEIEGGKPGKKKIPFALMTEIVLALNICK